MSRLFYGLAALLMQAGSALASTDALSTDGGRTNISYQPAKVVYDLTSGDPQVLGNILARVAILEDMYDAGPSEASIIIMIHGPSVPQFVRDNQEQHEENMARARDLASDGVIRFAMCEMSANFQGFKAEQIQDFVALVPMGDAELIRLQNMGYAYLR